MLQVHDGNRLAVPICLLCLVFILAAIQQDLSEALGHFSIFIQIAVSGNGGRAVRIALRGGQEDDAGAVVTGDGEQGVFAAGYSLFVEGGEDVYKRQSVGSASPSTRAA